MRAISSGETTRKRNAVSAKRSESATVMRATRTSDGAGGQAEAWAEVDTYAARVAPGAPYNFPMELLAAAQVKTTSVWTIGLPYNADVETEDRIVIGTDQFEVTGQWGSKRPLTELKVLCMKVE